MMTLSKQVNNGKEKSCFKRSQNVSVTAVNCKLIFIIKLSQIFITQHLKLTWKTYQDNSQCSSYLTFPDFWQWPDFLIITRYSWITRLIHTLTYTLNAGLCHWCSQLQVWRDGWHFFFKQLQNAFKLYFQE